MAASDARAGGAYVEVSLRSKIKAGAIAVQRDLKAVSTSLRSVGSAALGTGTAIAAPLIAGIAGVATVWGSFSQRMSEVRAVSGATREEFDRLSARAQQLGATTKFTASQAAEAMKFLGMAGYDAEQILAGIGPTLSLAAAGGLELGTAADIASDVSSAFNLMAEDIGRVSDVLAATATASNTTVEMMGEAFRYAAPKAAAAGQSIEETSAALGVLANSGIKATVAGTDVAGMLTSFVLQRDKLAAMGVEIEDTEGNMRSITDVMRDFGAASANMTNVERLEKADEIFGRYSKSALVLSSNIPALEKLKMTLDGSAGAAERMAAIMSDNLKGAFDSLTSAGEGLFIQLGKAADSTFRTILDSVTSSLRITTKFLEKNEGLAKVIVGVAIAATAASIALLGLGAAAVVVGAVVSAGSAIVGFFTWISGIAPIILTVSAALAGMAAIAIGFVAVGAKFGLFNGALEATRRTLGNLLSVANETFGGIAKAISGGDFVLASKILWAGVKVAFFTGMNDLTEILLGQMENLLKEFWNIISEIVRMWRELPTAMLTGVVSGIQINVGAIFKSGGLDAAIAELDALLKQADQVAARTQAEDAKANANAPGKVGQAGSSKSVNSEEAQTALDARIKALKDELASMELGTDAAELLALAREGVRDEDLAAVAALQEQRRELARKKKAEEDAAEAAKQLAEEGKSLAESLRTPREAFVAEVANIQRLLDAGVIDNLTATRALDRARSTLADSDRQSNPLALRGSKAAAETIRRQAGVSAETWVTPLVKNGLEQLNVQRAGFAQLNAAAVQNAKEKLDLERLEKLSEAQLKGIGILPAELAKVTTAIKEKNVTYSIP